MTAVGGVLLFPGAGGSSASPSLVAVDKALVAAVEAPGGGPLPVVRADFAYRREGRRAPDRPPKLLAAVRDEAAALAAAAGADPASLVLGGRSMGGRLCSMAVAEGLPAAGLVLMAYPLHPPGRPERLRIEHFPALDVPCLFVSGTRDPFGTPEEMEAHTAAIPGPVTHRWIEGGRHELKGADATVGAIVAEWVAALTRH